MALTPVALAAPASGVFGYTHLRSNGNRWMTGRGALPGAAPLDIPLAGEPRWVASARLGAGSVWVAVLDEGRVQAFRVEGTPPAAVPMPITPDRLPVGLPPLLRLSGGRASVATAPARDASPLTPPAILADGRLAYIARDGAFVLGAGSGRQERFAYRVPPDARILQDGEGRLLVLAGATTRYGHGVLGDRVEASSIVLLDPRRTPRIAVTIALPGGLVVEGIAPLWVDLIGDGVRSIVVTASDEAAGGRIQVYSETGRLVATGPAFSQGRRWRHPIAVAPFGPGGERELAVVRTPHIGGVVEFYRFEGSLRLAAELSGFTSHMLGSRNLDMGAAGDFDGDGRVELLLPDHAYTTLGAVRRTPEGAMVAWTVPLGGRLSTNLSAVETAGGRLAVGAGRQDRVLRVWSP